MRSWAFSGGVTVPVEGNCRVFAFGVLASQTPMWLTSQLSRGDLWCIMFCLLFKTMYANFLEMFRLLAHEKNFNCFSGLVMGTGTGIPGGYAGKGTDRVFCTRGHTHTHTRHTRTLHGGYTAHFYFFNWFQTNLFHFIPFLVTESSHVTTVTSTATTTSTARAPMTTTNNSEHPKMDDNNDNNDKNNNNTKTMRRERVKKGPRDATTSLGP